MSDNEATIDGTQYGQPSWERNQHYMRKRPKPMPKILASWSRWPACFKYITVEYITDKRRNNVHRGCT